MIKRLPLIIIILIIATASIVVTGFAESYDEILNSEYVIRHYQHLEVQPDEDSYVEGVFNSKLPIVSINTGGQEIPGEPVADYTGSVLGNVMNVDGEDTISAQIAIFDNEDEYNQLEDTPSIEDNIELRIRGNSSRYFDKKSYKISFVDEEGLEKNVDVMGMGAYDEWALYGPFLDKTMLRNYVYMNLYGEIYSETPDLRYCEVYIDGEYNGLYLMMETVAVDNDRVDLTSYTTRSDVTSYIVEADRVNDPSKIENFTFYTLNIEDSAEINIVYPGSPNQTPEFTDYILQDINEFEKALYSYDFDDLEKGYRAHINVDSFVDFYILNEFAVISDLGSRSTFLYKDLGGKITIGPAWDFNNAANLYFTEVPGSDAQGYLYHDRVWYAMLFKDDYFVDKVIERYRELRTDGILNEDKILNLIDETTLFLEDEIERNYDVWGYSFNPERLDTHNKLYEDDRNPISYQEALTDLTTFIMARGDWMDRNIEGLRQYSAFSKTKQFKVY